MTCDVLVLSNVDMYNYRELEIYADQVIVGNINKVYSVKQIQLIRRVIKQNNYEVIHTHLFGAQFFTVLATTNLKNKIKYITTEHSTYNRRRAKFFGRIIDKWSYKKYSSVIAISNGVRESLVEVYPFLKEKVIVIFNGINLNLYKNAKKYKKDEISSEFTESDILLIMVANFKDSKDHKTLIDAHSMLDGKYKLLLIGEGKNKLYYEEYVKTKKYSNVYFLGNRSDVPNLLKSSDVFVLSSYWEGFGLVTVEAAATGLPVIGNDITGLKEVIFALHGTVFESENPTSLKQAIETVIKEDRNFSDDVLTQFSIEKMIKQYISIYNL